MTPSANNPGLNDQWTAFISLGLFIGIFLLIRYLQKRG